jgi:hypothetical protein
VEEIEKQEILRLLADGSDALHAALSGVDEELAHRKPSPLNWSILECVEHVTLAETGLLSKLREAWATNESHADRAREAKFRELALNRARRIEAPGPAVPGKTAKTLVQAVDGFNAARRETVQFVEEFPCELRSWLATHPLITRPVNCYEMLLLMALHPKRHALQIEEIREALRGSKNTAEL